MDNNVLTNEYLNNIVENIVKIPIELIENKNISLYELFKKSQYCNYYNYITEDIIKIYLLNNLNYINNWLIYSEDKRVGKGYYIESKDEKYEVGYFNIYKENKIQILKTYTKLEEIDAFANFIKLELEYLRGNV